MTTHTPGPWTVEPATHHLGHLDLRIAADGYAVADVNVSVNKEQALVDEANARLIAAAPELLEALEHVEMVYKEREAAKTLWASELTHVRPMVQAALARAKGA